MKKIIRKKVLYRCSQCKTDYTSNTSNTSKKNARRCEKKPLEARIFGIGERVRNIEPRSCHIGNKPYFFSGTVTKIVGPEPPDYEYETKWLGGKRERLDSHVFMYQVKFRCPHCKEWSEARYYAPELKPAGRR